MTVVADRQNRTQPPIRPANIGRNLAEDIRSFSALSAEERAVLLQIGQTLRSIRFGTLIVVMQDGHVVQIETAERFRL